MGRVQRLGRTAPWPHMGRVQRLGRAARRPVRGEARELLRRAALRPIRDRGQGLRPKPCTWGRNRSRSRNQDQNRRCEDCQRWNLSVASQDPPARSKHWRRDWI
ncbi:unnamed protein product [Pleuronectes platessa]|uniref:Uncharacterized protein n=1 Tax=Pleuronectes platessa TaxID=8262 RepID=A0A9N7VTE0_PLEPL|nr:unnamed protein product [Pleuronectes platessa]